MSDIDGVRRINKLRQHAVELDIELPLAPGEATSLLQLLHRRFFGELTSRARASFVQRDW
jgi:hypothetical protein